MLGEGGVKWCARVCKRSGKKGKGTSKQANRVKGNIIGTHCREHTKSTTKQNQTKAKNGAHTHSGNNACSSKNACSSTHILIHDPRSICADLFPFHHDWEAVPFLHPGRVQAGAACSPAILLALPPPTVIGRGHTFVRWSTARP